jgi:lysozyme family protein
MIENYDRAFEFVMSCEGYKSDDHDDPGGRTIFGISARVHSRIVAELWDLPKEESRVKAKAFYLTHYWQQAGCNEISWPMDVIVFDTAVNLGVERALRMLNTSRSIYDFIFARIAYYVVISKGTKIKFLRGWLRRVLTLWDEIRERGE